MCCSCTVLACDYAAWPAVLRSCFRLQRSACCYTMRLAVQTCVDCCSVSWLQLFAHHCCLVHKCIIMFLPLGARRLHTSMRNSYLSAGKHPQTLVCYWSCTYVQMLCGHRNYILNPVATRSTHCCSQAAQRILNAIAVCCSWAFLLMVNWNSGVTGQYTSTHQTNAHPVLCTLRK